MRAIATVLALVSVSVAWGASNPAETVPFDHWAYDAFEKLVDSWSSGTYSSHTFRGDRPSTRYEFAVSVMRVLDIPRMVAAPGPRPPLAGEQGNRAVLQMVREFWPEIELILADQGLASAHSLREGLARIPPGNWLYETAQAILRDVGEAAVAEPFPDVPRDHWAFGAVERLRKAGIVVGYPDGRFGAKAFAPADTVPFD
jgi:hypothetical protein